jgi:hypothetical protein
MGIKTKSKKLETKNQKVRKGEERMLELRGRVGNSGVGTGEARHGRH